MDMTEKNSEPANQDISTLRFDGYEALAGYVNDSAGELAGAHEFYLVICKGMEGMEMPEAPDKGPESPAEDATEYQPPS